MPFRQTFARYSKIYVMNKETTISPWVIAAVATCVILTGALIRHQLRKSLTITAAVTVQDVDVRKQLPIADVEITAASGLGDAPSRSDSSGFFTLKLRKSVKKGQAVILEFRHRDYQPLDLPEVADDKLYVVHLAPLSKNADFPDRTSISVGNVRVRYSIQAMRTVNIGSAVQTFQVENVGNVPCHGQSPCSPDGKWKAAIASISLDAGPGNEFQNARVSCMAGPCPFTKIQSDEFSEGHQKITASARNWSDPATFLVEAEVVHTMQSEIDHQSYPVIFGSALHFTLPTNAEGVSLEADMAGKTIVFPLGPDLFLSWASCNARVNRDQTSVYRCELKPGYQFQ